MKNSNFKNLRLQKSQITKISNYKKSQIAKISDFKNLRFQKPQISKTSYFKNLKFQNFQISQFFAFLENLRMFKYFSVSGCRIPGYAIFTTLVKGLS